MCKFSYEKLFFAQLEAKIQEDLSGDRLLQVFLGLCWIGPRLALVDGNRPFPFIASQKAAAFLLPATVGDDWRCADWSAPQSRRRLATLDNWKASRISATRNWWADGVAASGITELFLDKLIGNFTI